MGWEQRGNNSYYYKKEREGSRVKSVYVGRCEVAQMVSKLQASSTEIEKLMRAKKAIEANEVERAEATLDRAIELTQLFTQATLVPTRNSVHSVIVDVRSIGLLPSRGHESCPIVVSFYAALVFTVTSKYANRDSCAASSACCVAASEEAGEPRSSRPVALGTAHVFGINGAQRW